MKKALAIFLTVLMIIGTLSVATVAFAADAPYCWTGHRDKELMEGFAATCDEDGKKDVYYCWDCWSYYLDAGMTQFICEDFNDNATRVALEQARRIPALGFSWDEGVITTPPTCTETGIITFTCTNGCEHTKTEPASALDHDWDNGRVTVEPTCTEDGVMTYTCLRDAQHTYTEPIPAYGHTEEEIPAVEPGCTETGLTAGVKCATCGEILAEQEVVPENGHSYEVVEENAPTCTENGDKTYECTVCGDRYSEDLDATGHSIEFEITAATCTEGGYTTYFCSCGYSYTADETEALGHVNLDGNTTCDVCEVVLLCEFCMSPVHDGNALATAFCILGRLTKLAFMIMDFFENF